MAGFNDPHPPEALVERVARMAGQKASLLTEVFPIAPAGPDPQMQALPVGTFEIYPGTVNIGGGSLAKAGLVSEVTVRPTHKRRGILRTMMELNLDRLAASGVPFALLIAAAGDLYGRFGFEAVGYSRTVRICAKDQFKYQEGVRKTVSRSGSVETVTLGWLFPRREQVYREYHSLMRLSVYPHDGFAEYTYFENASDEFKSTYRAAIHTDQSGKMDGYVIYNTARKETTEVTELIATNAAAELALWEHLVSIELVGAIEAKLYAAPSTLELALTDQRIVETKSWDDSLWVRTLDPIFALSQRAYSTAARLAGMGIVFEVQDPQGYAAGTFSLQLDEGGAELRRVDEPAQVQVSIRGLSSLVFGSAPPHILAGAGHITGATPAVVEYLDAMFAPVGEGATPADF